MHGFPPELYAITYRPKGNAELTRRVRELLGADVEVDDTWGIDHGAWTPLHHMLPHADYAVPTPDHYLPLLTVLGAAEGERAEVFNKVRNLGSISMTSYAFGLGK